MITSLDGEMLLGDHFQALKDDGDYYEEDAVNEALTAAAYLHTAGHLA